MKRKEKQYSIDEVLSKAILDKIKEKIRIDFDGDLINMNSDRYRTFKLKGTKCRRCGIEGQYFVKERCLQTEPYHFNLYAIDKDGHDVLMTKNHITPKSKGGEDNIENYETMCSPCNQDLGNGDVIKDKIIIQNYAVWIGKTVCKTSGKPFKSKSKVNTVKGVINHPRRVGQAFVFVEDDSFVSVENCRLEEK